MNEMRVRLPRLTLAIFGVASSLCAGQVATLSLAETRSMIRDRGVDVAEKELDSRWPDLLMAIASGNAGWVEIALDLGRHTKSAESGETLAAALGEALRKAPKTVLRRLNEGRLGVESVCGNCFAEMGIQGIPASSEKACLMEQEVAVSKVRDASLRKRRDLCLAGIRKRKAAAEKE